MILRSKVVVLVWLVVFCAVTGTAPRSAEGAEKEVGGQGVFDVRAFGAKGDGSILDTKSIQAAIDACAAAGGGRVVLAGGRFLSGTIELKSRVSLYMEAGAVLLGSTDLKDYPVRVQGFRSYTDNYTDKSLIYAEKAEGISILGWGTIDGQGKSFKGPYKVRPYMIRIIECENVTVRDVTIVNSPMWVQHYLACTNVLIDGITVHSKVNGNNDGIDIDCCDKVRISNCEVNSGDDAIVLKSTADRVCRDVTVTNCVLSSHCNAFKCGTESNGGFQNITVSNCTIYDTRLAGIALELVDGGVFDGVTVSNITMTDVRGAAIFIRLGNRARPYLSTGPGGSKGTFTAKPGAKKPGIGSMRNIVISNVLARGVGSTGCAITGLPDHPVENVTLENIRIRFKGGGTREMVERTIPEQESRYPEYSMFGELPAYGFYGRHAENLRFYRVDLKYEEEDQRPGFVFDDVNGLALFDVRAQTSAAAPMAVWLKQVRGGMIYGCRPGKTETVFLRLDGAGTTGISLFNNDLSGVKEIFQRGADVDDMAVFVGQNRMK